MSSARIHSGARFVVRAAQWIFALCVALSMTSGIAAESPSILLIAGAAGEAEFGESFSKQLESWERAAAKTGGHVTVVGRSPKGGTVSTDTPAPTTTGSADAPASAGSDLARVERAIAAEPFDGPKDLWVVITGHGTFDGKEAKFNLRGPDLSADDLAKWLKPIKRPLAVVVASSASAPFMAKLAAPGRVVIVATRSGYEQNYARFGQHIADAVADPVGDLDRDGQISLLEAFLTAAHRTAEFYKTDARLLTEHALIDDNGDGLGTPADWFRGTRAVKQAKSGAALDGARAHQWHLVPSEAERGLSPEARAKRNDLELKLEALRAEKPKLPPEDYARRLEEILVQLAQLYET